MLWLSGFIFFGSSNVIFERIRQVIEQQRDRPVEYMALDFSRVSGLDTSATLSLAKLRDFCGWHHVALAFSGFNENVRFCSSECASSLVIVRIRFLIATMRRSNGARRCF